MFGGHLPAVTSATASIDPAVDSWCQILFFFKAGMMVMLQGQLSVTSPRAQLTEVVPFSLKLFSSVCCSSEYFYGFLFVLLTPVALVMVEKSFLSNFEVSTSSNTTQAIQLTPSSPCSKSPPDTHQLQKRRFKLCVWHHDSPCSDPSTHAHMVA